MKPKMLVKQLIIIKGLCFLLKTPIKEIVTSDIKRLKKKAPPEYNCLLMLEPQTNSFINAG